MKTLIAFIAIIASSFSLNCKAESYSNMNYFVTQTHFTVKVNSQGKEKGLCHFYNKKGQKISTKIVDIINKKGHSMLIEVSQFNNVKSLVQSIKCI